MIETISETTSHGCYTLQFIDQVQKQKWMIYIVVCGIDICGNASVYGM